MEALTEKVSPSWGANKKLAGLQMSAAPGRSASFLQTQRSDSFATSAVGRVTRSLAEAAKNIGSPVLAQLAVRIGSSDDHFVTKPWRKMKRAAIKHLPRSKV